LPRIPSDALVPEDDRNDRRIPRQSDCTSHASRQLADALNESLPEGREKAVVMTKLEEVMFWANAAVARDRTEDL
jgi:hypothetical protein